MYPPTLTQSPVPVLVLVAFRAPGHHLGTAPRRQGHPLDPAGEVLDVDAVLGILRPWDPFFKNPSRDPRETDSFRPPMPN